MFKLNKLSMVLLLMAVVFSYTSCVSSEAEAEDTKASIVVEPGTAEYPSDIIGNYKQWYITYPDGVNEKDLKDKSNEYFYVNEDKNGIVFRAPVRSDNGTTPNSTHIRSELRERTEDGSENIYWTTDGHHVLYVKQAITHLPIVKKIMVATQIHGDKSAGIDDAMVLRLEDKVLQLSFNGRKLRSNVVIKPDYELGTIHEVIFEVKDNKHYVYYGEDGGLNEAFKNGDASRYIVKQYEDDVDDFLLDLWYDKAYFKVGNYTQSNADKEGAETGKPENYGEVVVYDMWVSHN